MADVAENLRAFLLADATIAAKCQSRIAQDIVPQPDEADKDSAGRLMPFCYFARSGVRLERCLGESGGAPFGQFFDVEFVAQDDAQSQALATYLFTLDGYSGLFGASTVQAIFVEDQADDYLPKAADLSRGEFVSALRVEVYP